MLPETTDVLLRQCVCFQMYVTISEDFLSVIKRSRFVILLYGTTNEQSDVNMTRKQIFCLEKQIDCIPPIKEITKGVCLG